MVVTLGYWDIRGLAHAIRLLLEYTETPYQERRYKAGPAPDFDPSDWTNEKEKLGLDFPNLPYLIDGDVKLTQSNAILRYIARKHNMCGETEVEKQRVDVLENHLMDLRMAFARLCYSPDFEKLKPAYLEQLPGKLRQLSRFLGSRSWFVGDKLTFVDFLAYDVLDQQRMFVPDCPELQGNLSQFLQRFEALEKISAYMRSGRFMKAPIFWYTALWNNKKE
ncbi:glutathione S-transferase 2 [Gallus gallus]|uniref:Glutathione S-transferase 2 n=2 Tax=Gallus gallus TaxID=9031 RepID=GSTM2_CHICK|nr:glutathione S-transferase 2 [Gallus gallus]P20136.4 RecName: Full=Glutathione S-transferase 2; AltName: Full=GST class-mu; AltName: Full=GST-CL2; AltName: Full=GSTM1-1 [Gallus gallus]CAA41202.1 glutathione S-transferases CL2 [Gallus gallus]|eukprot:NP_990421.1 glutathione S-transferase 2 [Gallus gallus]